MGGEGGRSLGVVLGVGTGFDVFPSAVSEVEQADDAHGGEAAAGFLNGGLGVEELVFPGIHELDGTAVHGFEGEAVPLVAAADAAVEMVDDALVDLLEE